MLRLMGPTTEHDSLQAFGSHGCVASRHRQLGENVIGQEFFMRAEIPGSGFYSAISAFGLELTPEGVLGMLYVVSDVFNHIWGNYPNGVNNCKGGSALLRLTSGYLRNKFLLKSG